LDTRLRRHITLLLRLNLRASARGAAGALACVALLALQSRLALAQSVDAFVIDEAPDAEAIEPLDLAPSMSLEGEYEGQYVAGAPYDAHPYGGDECCDGGTEPYCNGVSWISGPYFKAGVASAVGSDLLETGRNGGYAISGGIRQPFGPDLLNPRYFFDVGGGYLSAFGDTTRVTTATQTTILGVVSSINQSTTLDEVRRGSAHLAIGRFWGDYYDDRGRDPQVRLALRFGGRLGHVRGSFQDTPLVAPPAGATVTANYSKTDTFGGLFLGAEAVLLERQYAFGQCKWTLEGEFANDWVDFESFHSGSFVTASVLVGFMLSR
jgi:hypothetical protein